MVRLAIGIICLGLALVLALVAGPALGTDLHPIVTGLVGIGIVSAAVGLVERRGERPDVFGRRRG